ASFDMTSNSAPVPIRPPPASAKLDYRASARSSHGRRAAVPAVREPERRGLGTKRIERVISYDMQGKAEKESRPDGLRLGVAFPLSWRQAGARRADPCMTMMAGPKRASAISRGDEFLIALETDQMLHVPRRSARAGADDGACAR